MSKARHPKKRHETELLGAALRYCAAADWFESPKGRKAGELAMTVFTHAEAELRQAGAAAMRQHGHRELVLQAAGVPQEAR